MDFLWNNAWIILPVIIAMISLGVSIWAIRVSKRANNLAETQFNREKEIEKPVLFNVHVDGGDRFVLVIEDYSANKNLRIDTIEGKLPEDDNYKQIPFDVNRNDSVNPPQVTLRTYDKFNVLDGCDFKIYTNFGEIKYKYGSMFSTENTNN